jgi:ATP phosphoribosyltransferase
MNKMVFEKTADRVRIAVQKSGRMAEESLSLLRNCGLHIDRSKDQLFCRIKELPIDLLLIRDDDIHGFVSSGICDLGIVGENVFTEMREEGNSFAAQIVERLGFSFCRLSIAVPESSRYDKLKDLDGLTIATSYPNLLGRALAQDGVTAKTLVMTGSVEVAPRLRIADAICDLVASGATLASNNLREIDVLLKSEALLIRGACAFCAEKETIIGRLLNRIRGVIQAEDSKYIMLHAQGDQLDEIVKLLPGSESPTILPLKNSDNKFAVHAVCREAVFWETMERLKNAGASSILVMPIEKMMA